MPDTDNDTPQVRDARPPIRGLMPGNMQARLLGAIALLMVLVIAFSGRKSPAEKKPAPISPAQTVIDPSLPRIQQYQSAIDEATRKLAAEEEELAHTKQNLGAQASEGPSGRGGSVLPAALNAPSYRDESLQSGLEAEREQREYRSLFASNIALTYRSSRPAGTPSEVAVAPSKPTEPALEQTEHDPEDGYKLLEGTILESVLTNRLDSSFSGPVNCMVTTAIYSRDHAALLIPQGTRVLGEVRKVESQGDQRLAVFFHRLIRPDGYSISLDRFQGLSQIGETGLQDQVNRHYLQVFGASLAIGAIAGLAQANTRYSVDESAADTYQQGVATSLSQSSMHVLDRFLNVLPTFTIREGQRIKIYLSQDLTIPAYDPHRESSGETHE